MMEHFGSCIDSFHLASIIKGQDLGMDGLSITKSTEEMERWSRGRIRKSGKRKRSGLNGRSRTPLPPQKVLSRGFSFLSCLHSLLFPCILSLRQVAAALPNCVLLFLKRKTKWSQHATSNPHRSTRIAQHFLCKNITTQHALPSQGAAAGAESKGAGEAGRTQRALRRWVKSNTERQRGGGKENKGGEGEELRAASAHVT